MRKIGASPSLSLRLRSYPLLATMAPRIRQRPQLVKPTTKLGRRPPELAWCRIGEGAVGSQGRWSISISSRICTIRWRLPHPRPAPGFISRTLMRITPNSRHSSHLSNLARYSSTALKRLCHICLTSARSIKVATRLARLVTPQMIRDSCKAMISCAKVYLLPATRATSSLCFRNPI